MAVIPPNELDQYLAPAIRKELEERYYARVNEQSLLDRVPDINLLLQPPYPALWADHGVVHVRNVAQNIVQVLEIADGVLLPRRSPERLAFMRAYGVMLAYVHDIGMVDFSHFGRAMHPEFATQTVMSFAFDDILQAIWQENGVVVQRLKKLWKATAAKPSPIRRLGELLSMSNCHSKSKIPVMWFNQRSQLRRIMQKTVCTSLQELYQEQAVAQARQALSVAPKLELGKPEINRLARLLQNAGQEPNGDTPAMAMVSGQNIQAEYKNFEKDSYRWLVAADHTSRALADDVIDTLRALRCADALRQRGTVLKTSGQYEIFVDQNTAHAIYALRFHDERLFLLEVPDYVGAGEANVASSELDPAGNLRISFHRGSFGSSEAFQRALYSAALIVNDLHADVIESFVRPGKPPARLKRAEDLQILLETVDDNLGFAERVIEQLESINPEAAKHARTVPSLKSVSAGERQRYLEGDAPNWDTAAAREALRRIATAGHKTAAIDPVRAFEHVKRVQLAADEVLIEPGTTAGFVYIPLGEGLEILPLGGYAPLAARAWTPLGITGVIRGAVRNARVVARCPVSLLMIPRDVYLKHWHSTYTTDELRILLQPYANLTG